MQKVFEDFQRPYQEASQTYTKTFQEAAGKPEGFQSLQKAQFDLFKRLAEPLPPETGKELQGRVEEAYRNYLRDLQKALSQVDVSALDSSALVTVGQGLATAAYWLSAVQSPGPSA